jgi:hypothetical protein
MLIAGEKILLFTHHQKLAVIQTQSLSVLTLPAPTSPAE